jgi:hypothetical protein
MTVPGMEQLGYGLIILLNGVFAAFGALLTPLTAAAVVTACSLGWMARLEIDEVNRRATKPQVGLH